MYLSKLSWRRKPLLKIYYIVFAGFKLMVNFNQPGRLVIIFTRWSPNNGTIKNSEVSERQRIVNEKLKLLALFM